MQPAIAAIREEFAKVFGAGGRVHVIRAPGRVNLIGEHTDYNDGFVLPMAIEPEVRIACRARDDGRVRVQSVAVRRHDIVEFSVQDKIERGEPKWSNYVRGVAAEMKAAGIPLTGMDALIENTLPMGGGLSSSAALEVGIGVCLLTLGGLDIDTSRLALVCQKAEHEYALVPCGIMDQMIVSSAKAGNAMLLDCRDLSRQFVPIESADLRVVIANSMVRHNLAGGEYAKRRQQCEQGVAFFAKHNPAVKALRDVSMRAVEESAGQLDDVVFRRCRHIVGESHRTTEAARLLEKREYEQVGQFMIQSHNSLRDDYEVSCPELDFLVEEAVKVKGVYGARMTGGGFGGCIVALTQPRSAEALIEHLRRVYKPKYNLDPQCFVTTATAGAGEIV